MYTKKINYVNDAILKKYEFELEENENLVKIMDDIVMHFKNISFSDIKKVDEDYEISFISNKKEMLAFVCLEENKLTYQSMDNDVKIVKNISKYCDVLEGITYNNRRRFVISNTDFLRMNTFRYIDDKNCFNIILKFKYKKEEIKNIINSLLDENRAINSIRDIYYNISENIDLSDKSLLIQSPNGKNIINVYNGKLMNYIETRKMNDYEEIMYLDGGEFYIKKTIKDNLDPERIPFVKKMDGHYE